LAKKLIDITDHSSYDVVLNDVLEQKDEVKELLNEAKFNNLIVSLT